MGEKRQGADAPASCGVIDLVLCDKVGESLLREQIKWEKTITRTLLFSIQKTKRDVLPCQT